MYQTSDTNREELSFSSKMVNLTRNSKINPIQPLSLFVSNDVHIIKCTVYYNKKKLKIDIKRMGGREYVQQKQ